MVILKSWGRTNWKCHCSQTRKHRPFTDLLLTLLLTCGGCYIFYLCETSCFYTSDSKELHQQFCYTAHMQKHVQLIVSILGNLRDSFALWYINRWINKTWINKSSPKDFNFFKPDSQDNSRKEKLLNNVCQQLTWQKEAVKWKKEKVSGGFRAVTFSFLSSDRGSISAFLHFNVFLCE